MLKVPTSFDIHSHLFAYTDQTEHPKGVLLDILLTIQLHPFARLYSVLHLATASSSNPKQPPLNDSGTLSNCTLVHP